ncbi:hypothetical protein GF402_10875 [Candidatus Fermentibacteria bacterium]|nr:hypothetical protein [Candidatus Fermentibacteria bacterium]
MKVGVVIVVIGLVSAAIAQTPFEFAVVQDLVGGEPHVSVLRIEIVPDQPSVGDKQLQIAARAGLYMLADDHLLFADSANRTDVLFSGSLRYSLAVPLGTVRRIMEVLADNIQRFSMTGISHISLDLLSADDMTWISIRSPISMMDSVVGNRMGLLEFWRKSEISKMEVGTYGFPVTVEPVGALAVETLVDTITVYRDRSGSAQAWKSLLLPGWGQLSSGRGLGWLNLLAEAAGVALMVSDETEAGAAVIGVNHLVSFTDLL